MMNFVRRFLCSLLQRERVIKQKCTFSSSCWFLPFLFPLLFLSCLLTLPNIKHYRFTSINSKMAIRYRMRTIITRNCTVCCICLPSCCFGLETRVIVKISPHPCYPINNNIDWFSCNFLAKKQNFIFAQLEAAIFTPN